MTHDEAVQAVKSGRPVRRAAWPEKQFVKASSTGTPIVTAKKEVKEKDSKGKVHVISSPTEKPYEWTDEDKAATDWIAA